MQLQDIAFV